MKLKLLFFSILAIEIYSSLMGYKQLMYCTKPLLMPILMIIAYLDGKKNIFLYLALFFSLLGDVFLMFNGANFFILGLLAFLIAHIFYILLYKKQFIVSYVKPMPFLAFTFAYFLYLKPSIPSEFFVPVLVYCFVLTLMGIFAACRKTTNETSYNWVLIGSILFIISDSLIAYNKFASPIYLSSLWVMSTYGLAQFMIVKGWKN